MIEFRFPIPRSERVLLILATSATVGATLALVFLMRDLAAGANLTLGEFLSRSPHVRMPFAGLCAVMLVSLYALASFVRSKQSAHLRIDDDQIRFSRRGAYGLPLGASEVALRCAEVNVVRAQRVRRGSVVRVEAEVVAGREHIRVNLQHATPGSAIDERDSATWLAHPLVTALESATHKKATVL